MNAATCFMNSKNISHVIQPDGGAAVAQPLNAFAIMNCLNFFLKNINIGPTVHLLGNASSQSSEAVSLLLRASLKLMLLAIAKSKDSFRRSFVFAIEQFHFINDLEAEDLTLKNKLEGVERKNKSNNLVIFGFDKDPAKISPQIVINELNKLLEVNVDIRDINNIYCMGKNKNCPMKVEFVIQLRIKGILQNTRKLKNTIHCT
ncbi:hypothetical protein JTB14_013373 [Gonioctena quinquepunctata]|nr:hypothetical protein JTB14_013373 [Gonioctena quinquepunctata]